MMGNMLGIQDVYNAITDAETKRQMIEDIRANKRNLNRVIMLATTVAVGIPVVFLLQSLGTVGQALMPFAFVITALFDCLVTLYAYIRKL